MDNDLRETIKQTIAVFKAENESNQQNGSTERQQSTFAVPRVRGDQLRDLAAHHRTTCAGLIGQWIDRGLQEAGLSTALPGVEIERNDQPAVTLRIGDLAIAFPERQDALDAANALESVSHGAGGVMLLPGSGALSVTRRGDGIVLKATTPEGATSRKSFSPDVARALARQLRSQAC